MTFLPADVSRCIGKPAGPQGLNFPEECKNCARRQAARTGYQVFSNPPAETPCPLRIPVEPQ